MLGLCLIACEHQLAAFSNQSGGNSFKGAVFDAKREANPSYLLKSPSLASVSRTRGGESSMLVICKHLKPWYILLNDARAVLFPQAPIHYVHLLQCPPETPPLVYVLARICIPTKSHLEGDFRRVPRTLHCSHRYDQTESGLLPIPCLHRRLLGRKESRSVFAKTAFSSIHSRTRQIRELSSMRNC